MKAVRIERMARRLWVLCAMGIPLGAAISDEPRPVSEQAVVELVGPKWLNSGPVSTVGGTDSRSYAILRPTKQTGNQPTLVMQGSPATNSPHAQSTMSIRRVAHNGHEFPPEVGPVQLNPLATPTSNQPVAQRQPLIEQAVAKQPLIQENQFATPETQVPAVPPESKVVPAAAELEPLEFSLCEDSLDDALLEIEIPEQPTVNEELVLKNRQCEIPPTLLRPGAKTHLVASTGQNSSIKIPKLPLVNDVLAAGTDSAQLLSQQTKTPVPATMDADAANHRLTKVAKQDTDASNPPRTNGSVLEAPVDHETPGTSIATPKKESTVASTRRTVNPEKAAQAAEMQRPGTVKLEPAVQANIEPAPAPLPAFAPQASPRPALEMSLQSLDTASTFANLGEKLQSLRLKNGQAQSIVIPGTTQVAVEDPDLCDAVAVNGNILFVPKQSGVCRVAILKPGVTTNYPWLEVTVESSGPMLADRVITTQLQQLIDQRFSTAKVYIEPLPEGIQVRGETANNEQAKEILLLVRQSCLCPVLDRLSIRTR